MKSEAAVMHVAHGIFYVPLILYGEVDIKIRLTGEFFIFTVIHTQFVSRNCLGTKKYSTHCLLH